MVSVRLLQQLYETVRAPGSWHDDWEGEDAHRYVGRGGDRVGITALQHSDGHLTERGVATRR